MTSADSRPMHGAKYRVGDRVEGFASKPTGALGTVSRVLKPTKHSRTQYRVAWDNGGSSICSPLAMIHSTKPDIDAPGTSVHTRLGAVSSAVSDPGASK